MDAIDGDYIIQDYIKRWNANKRYLLRILSAMPEDAYDFKPTVDMKSFKSQATHIASWLTNHFKKMGHSGLTPFDKSNKRKIIASYEVFFDEIIAYVSQLNPNELKNTIKMWYGQSTKSRLMNLMDNHLAHHRGQMVVYLRLKGIKPPSYVGW